MGCFTHFTFLLPEALKTVPLSTTAKTFLIKPLEPCAAASLLSNQRPRGEDTHTHCAPLQCALYTCRVCIYTPHQCVRARKNISLYPQYTYFFLDVFLCEGSVNFSKSDDFCFAVKNSYSKFVLRVTALTIGSINQPSEKPVSKFAKHSWSRITHRRIVGYVIQCRGSMAPQLHSQPQPHITHNPVSIVSMQKKRRKSTFIFPLQLAENNEPKRNSQIIRSLLKKW